MKIQCDVCSKDEATMFCVADDAALCAACDHRVHHANKLAGRHHRFSLLQPSTKEPPRCDICQEKRALLFCQQDRAILCKDCDESIHKANQHTQKHNRFLLTGIKVSATSSLYSDSTMPPPSTTTPPTSACATSQSNSISYDVPSFKPQNTIRKPVSETPTNCFTPSSVKTSTIVPVQGGGNGELMNGSTSSISEYLIETLPGWHVEDFLDISSANGFSKNTNEMQVQSFWDIDYSRNLNSTATDCTSLWVPQVSPATPLFNQPYSTSNIAFGAQIDFKDAKDALNLKPNRKRVDDNCFAVPQICQPSNTFKRSRNLWQ